MLERGGVVGDRRFWLQDERGALYAGKRDGTLLRIRPEWDETTRLLGLNFPNGERVEGVVELGDHVDADLYRRPRASRRVIGPWEEAISRYVGRPLTLLWADDGAVDRTPEGGTVSLVSRASLERLREKIGLRDELDGRRFRMLFEIDGVEAHEEDEWIGGEVRIGDATVAFNGDIGRCIITSRDPDTGTVDVPTLVTLASYRPEGRTESLPFGIYGVVACPGRAGDGDTVTPSSTARCRNRPLPSASIPTLNSRARRGPRRRTR
jgi:uncharacterized protein